MLQIVDVSRSDCVCNIHLHLSCSVYYCLNVQMSMLTLRFILKLSVKLAYTWQLMHLNISRKLQQ